jgi:hypothetical protein
MHIREEAWQESCSCPGAEQERQILAEVRAEQPPIQFQAYRDAIDAVKAKATGKNHQEIRNHYKAELRAHGLTIPSEVWLDRQAYLIAGDFRPVIHLISRGLGLPKFIPDMFRPPM